MKVYKSNICLFNINSDGSYEGKTEDGVGILIHPIFIRDYGIIKAEEIISGIFFNKFNVLDQFSKLNKDFAIDISTSKKLTETELRSIIKIHSILVSESDENNFTGNSKNNSIATLWVNTKKTIGSGIVEVEIGRDFTIINC